MNKQQQLKLATDAINSTNEYLIGMNTALDFLRGLVKLPKTGAGIEAYQEYLLSLAIRDGVSSDSIKRVRALFAKIETDKDKQNWTFSVEQEPLLTESGEPVKKDGRVVKKPVGATIKRATKQEDPKPKGKGKSKGEPSDTSVDWNDLEAVMTKVLATHDYNEVVNWLVANRPQPKAA